MVADWPGLMTTGAAEAAGLMAASSRSPVVEVTDVSNCLATTNMAELALPAGAGPEYGPHSVGAEPQNPFWMVPPGGLSLAVSVVAQSGPAPGVWLEVSGSPWNGPQSNMIGSVAATPRWRWTPAAART